MTALSPVLIQTLSDLLERPPTSEEAGKFERYLELILQWNRIQRLTAYRSPEDIVLHLLFDSLLFLRILPPTAQRLLDFGSGAGIPGIPLKIVLPRVDLALVEGRRRRGSFLATVLRELGLEDATLLKGRAEQILLEHPEVRESFDAVLARGAGPPSAVIPVALQFLRPRGIFILSGPPARKYPFEIPRNFSAFWTTVPSPLRPEPRRFLVFRKGD